MTPDQAMQILAGSAKAIEHAVVGAGRGLEAPLYLLVTVQAFGLVRHICYDLHGVIARRRYRESCSLQAARRAEDTVIRVPVESPISRFIWKQKRPRRKRA